MRSSDRDIKIYNFGLTTPSAYDLYLTCKLVSITSYLHYTTIPSLTPPKPGKKIFSYEKYNADFLKPAGIVKIYPISVLN